MKKIKYLIAGGLVVCISYFVSTSIVSKNKLAQKEIEKLTDTLTYYKDFNENLTSCLKDSKYNKYLNNKKLLNKIQSAYLVSYNDIQNKENLIIEYSTRLVRKNDNDEAKGAFESVEGIVKGPHLTILDGAPGTGKSTTLAEALKYIKAPIICLGSTPSAAKGLYDDMFDANPEARIFGGVSVDQFINPQTQEQKTARAKVDYLTAYESKIIFMVDEAGLLNHDQMYSILKYAAEVNAIKIILTGDSRQVLPSKGVPFRLLTETLKGTKAYVTTSYILRQWNFLDKMITSGIYNGLYSDKILINKEFGSQILNSGYYMNKGAAEPPRVGEYFEQDKNGSEIVNPMASLIGPTNRKGEMTFKEYVDKKYPKLSTKEAIEKYVEYLADNVETLVGTTDDDLRNKLNIGPTKENYDSYLASALVLQQMGVRGYEVRGMLNQEKSGDDLTLLKNVAKEIALNYGNPKKFKQGMLAITQSEEDASKLNNFVREEMKKANTLPKREPVYVDGAKSLMSAEEIAKLTIPYSYAYALDVTTSQGMTMGGKVIFVITKENQAKMRGGEILVGCSRHRSLVNQFEIKLSAKADKELFYRHSIMQQAGLKVAGDVFSAALYNVATGNTDKTFTDSKLESSQAQIERDKQGFKDYLKANACFFRK
ncbi:MAG: AAA family ATPase [Alphaproteobacteria bacterium]|nr:AAA family ATPase [Alphaproteobacteria bacterium]